MCVCCRSCWVCFATDEDDRTAEWVRPCRCRGSTKWVHQSCLQRWVDEKQRGNSTARVACPQCNAEYLIVFPKLGETHLPQVTDQDRRRGLLLPPQVLWCSSPELSSLSFTLMLCM